MLFFKPIIRLPVAQPGLKTGPLRNAVITEKNQSSIVVQLLYSLAGRKQFRSNAAEVYTATFTMKAKILHANQAEKPHRAFKNLFPHTFYKFNKTKNFNQPLSVVKQDEIKIIARQKNFTTPCWLYNIVFHSST